METVYFVGIDHVTFGPDKLYVKQCEPLELFGISILESATEAIENVLDGNALRVLEEIWPLRRRYI